MSVSQAKYNTTFEGLGIFTAAWRTAGRFAKSFAGYEDSIYIRADGDNQIEFLELRGLNRANNTDTDGTVYVSLASSAGDYHVVVYSNSSRAASQAICSATGSGLTAQEVTLSATNSSGVSGLISLTVFSAADSDITGHPRWNIPGLCDDYDPTDDSDETLADYRSTHMASMKATAKTIGAALLGYQDSIKSEVDSYMQGAVARLIDSGYITTGELLTKETTVSGGAVTNEYTGIIKDLDDQLDQDSQYFRKNTTSLGSLTSGAGQQGRISATTKTPCNYVIDEDVFTIRCNKEIGSTVEEFTVHSHNYGEAENVLRLGANFRAPEIGISLMKLDRDVDFGSYSPASGSTYFAETFSNDSFTISGETEDYIDEGNVAIYGEASKSAATSNITISYYRASGRASADKIATITFSNPGNDNIVSKTVAEAGGSGITIMQPCDDLDSMPSGTTYTWTVDLNLNQEGDYYQAEASNDNEGLWANILGRMYKYEFPTTSATNETISEDYTKIWEDWFVDKTYM